MSGFGHNTRMSPHEAKRAILERVQANAKSKGQQVPDDIVEFLERADVLFLDEHNKAVRFSRVVIAWED